MPQAFDELITRFHEHRSEDPNACINLGLPKRLGELPDPSAEAMETFRTRAQSLAREFASVDDKNLNADQSLDRDLAILALQADAFSTGLTFNERPEWAQMPRAGDEISDGIFMLFINDPRPAHQRLDDIVSRVQAIPEYLERLTARLDTPVARWAAIDQEKVADLPDFFTSLYNWAEGEDYGQLERFQVAIQHAKEAIDDYQKSLAQMPKTESFAIGMEKTRELVRLTGIEKSLEELHQMAREFLTENEALLDDLRGRLAAKYSLSPEMTVAQLHKELNRRFAVKAGHPPDFDKVLQRYQEEREKILEFIRNDDLFPIPDEQDMKILKTPKFMEPSIPAGAMMPPAPFREGSKISLVYLTLRAELLDEHTDLGIPVMMIHEGIPGHHLQLSTAAGHPSTIRRHMNAAEQAEGWTTMLEDYMLDVGYMGNLTDECRFVSKRELARIGARVAIDLFFMTGEKGFLDVGRPVDLSSDDPFTCAGNLLQEVTGFTDARVQAELNWYSQERGTPLCYLTGNQLVWELKRELKASQEERKDDLEVDRLFHYHYLTAGNMPVSFLRRYFADRNLI